MINVFLAAFIGGLFVSIAGGAWSVWHPIILVVAFVALFLYNVYRYFVRRNDRGKVSNRVA